MSCEIFNLLFSLQLKGTLKRGSRPLRLLPSMRRTSSRPQSLKSQEREREQQNKEIWELEIEQDLLNQEIASLHKDLKRKRRSMLFVGKGREGVL